MINLYEEFKQMLMQHKKEVAYKKEEFDRDIKALTKDARAYRLQLINYEEEMDRNIDTINKKLRKFPSR